MFKTKFLVIAALFSLALIGCDKGRKSLNGTMDQYGAIMKQELTETNLEDAKKLALLLKVIGKAHSDKGSGKEALKILGELRTKAESRLQSLNAELQAEQQKLGVALTPLEKKSEELINEIAKKKSNFLTKFPFKKGDCIANRLGSEFDKSASVFRLEIQRIDEIGNDEVLVSQIYAPKVEDLDDVSMIGHGAEPKAKSKFIVHGAFKIDCKRAGAFASEYSEIMNTGKSLSSITTQIRSLNIIKSDQII